jgi:hypothetical protein
MDGALRATDAMTVVEKIVSEAGDRMVEVYRRDNGTFGFDEYLWDADEAAWCQLGGGAHSYGIFDTLERAIAEAKARVAWRIREH